MYKILKNGIWPKLHNSKLADKNTYARKQHCQVEVEDVLVDQHDEVSYQVCSALLMPPEQVAEQRSKSQTSQAVEKYWNIIGVVQIEFKWLMARSCVVGHDGLGICTILETLYSPGCWFYFELYQRLVVVQHWSGCWYFIISTPC